MEIHNLLDAKSRAELREWLMQNYKKEKERCRRMERLGLMTDAGRAVLPDMSPQGFTIDKDILQRLESDPVVWNNFCQLPDLYKRVRIDTIQIKRNQPKLFESRLNKFIENTRKGLLYGEWNDNGRL